jgi:rsbT co-antagonist protein RsbR
VGAITVQSEKPHAFDEHQKQVLEAIAHLAAPSLENARLVNQLQTSLQSQAGLLQTIQALSTPLIPVAQGIVVLPLIGNIDQSRAQGIIEALLNGIVAHQAEVVLIDITGVPMVDTLVANSLMQAARAARLVGCQVMLVGIRPEVAQTVVSLGLELGELANFANLQGGIEAALRMRGLQITRVAKVNK